MKGRIGGSAAVAQSRNRTHGDGRGQGSYFLWNSAAQLVRLEYEVASEVAKLPKLRRDLSCEAVLFEVEPCRRVVGRGDWWLVRRGDRQTK